MLKIFSRAAEHPFQFILCILLALIPSIVWMMIFNKKYKQRKSALGISFIMGIASAFIVLLYQYYWGREFNLGFFFVEPVNFQQNIHSKFSHPILASLLVFLSVGFLEEYSKHWVIKGMHSRFFRSIDDVIEISIVAALGFAFLENIGYFFQMVLRHETKNLVGLFVMRSIFVVFVHILCSGVYGYFYGIGYFSQRVFKDELNEGRKFYIPEILHRIFHFRKERVFHDEMISLGLIVSVLLHGFYDFVLDINLSLGAILHIPFLNGIMFHQIVLPLFLVFGLYFLNRLIENKEDMKIMGKKVVIEKFEVADDAVGYQDSKQVEIDRVLEESGLKDKFYKT